MGKVGQLYREDLVNQLKQGIEDNQNVFLLNYSAVSAFEMDSLRKDLKRIGAKVYVSRNRLAGIALKDMKYDQLSQALEGQVAFVWSNADAVTISKALKDFSDKREGVIVRGGLLNGTILKKEDVNRLSNLPSREILLSQVLSTIISPLTRLAGAMNAKTRDLLSIIKQYSEKKGGN